MIAQLGDQIMIIPRGGHEPVREGHIREVRHDPGGVVYLVQWSDTDHESLLPHGPDVMIKRRRPGGTQPATREETVWQSQLRHPLARRHTRDLERRRQAAYERLAERVEEIITGLGLIEEDFSIGGERIYHVPQVVAVDPGPPVKVDIHILPGQSPEIFSVHAETIAYDLGMAEVRIIRIAPSAIRLELIAQNRFGG